MYPNQQLSQLVNSLHPSSYSSFHGGQLKFLLKTFTMFFLMSSTGSLNFIPFVNSSKTVIFLSFLPVARGLFRPSLGHHQRREAIPDGRPVGRFGYQNGSVNDGNILCNRSKQLGWLSISQAKNIQRLVSK